MQRQKHAGVYICVQPLWQLCRCIASANAQAPEQPRGLRRGAEDGPSWSVCTLCECSHCGLPLRPRGPSALPLRAVSSLSPPPQLPLHSPRSAAAEWLPRLPLVRPRISPTRHQPLHAAQAAGACMHAVHAFPRGSSCFKSGGDGFSCAFLRMSFPLDERHPVGPCERGRNYSGLEFEDDALVVLYNYLVSTEGSAAVDMHKLLKPPYGRVPTAAARVSSSPRSCRENIRMHACTHAYTRVHACVCMHGTAVAMHGTAVAAALKASCGECLSVQPGGGCSSFGRAITEDVPPSFIFGSVG